MVLYDKSGEEHFNLISALQRASGRRDPDAALYWLARMLEGGEDRLYIARRLVRMAIEDIGLADPRALEQAMAVQQAVHFLGTPEGDLALAQVAIYLAVAPKSDAAYKALNAAMEAVKTSIAEPVPMQLRNAPTRSMKEWGYGAGYQHAHKFEDAHQHHGMPAGQSAGNGVLTSRLIAEWSRGLRERIREIRKTPPPPEDPPESRGSLYFRAVTVISMCCAGAGQPGYSDGGASRARVQESLGCRRRSCARTWSMSVM